MKKNVLWALLDLVFLAVFNAVFFILGGFEHPASVWVSYGFIHFAYVMILLTPFLGRKGSQAALFGFTIYSISSTYFFVEFVAGLVFILMKSESIKASLVTQIIIAGLYAVILLSNLIANEHTADTVERKESEVEYINMASSKVRTLINIVTDKKAAKAIEKAYDALHASPTKSSEVVHSLEMQILNLISELEEAVSQKESERIISISGEIMSLVNVRNQKLRLSQ